tara:strand:+ start:1300 stop:2577 length:1278 start_codon:yes stop_codon:yes gene_type:complete
MANAGLGGVQGSMIENMGSQQGVYAGMGGGQGSMIQQQGGLGWGNSSQPAPNNIQAQPATLMPEPIAYPPNQQGNFFDDPYMSGGGPMSDGGMRGGLAGLPLGNVPQQAPNIFDTASSGINQAIGAAGQATQYQPMNVRAGQSSVSMYNPTQAQYTTPINAQNVQAGQIANTDLSAYTNPFENQVVGQTLGDLDRTRQMQANQLGAQSTAAGAFGGSRSALMQSELNRNYLDQASKTASGLRATGFQNAQQMAGQDIGSNLQASLANQAANLQAGTNNAQMRQAINLANQGASNTASQFGASALNQGSQYNTTNQLQAALANQNAGLQGAQQRLSGANQLGQLSNLGFGMGMQLQDKSMQQGTQQQLINQALIDAAKQQFAGFTGQPSTALGYLASALGASAKPSTTEQTKTPGLFDYLTLGASL